MASGKGVFFKVLRRDLTSVGLLGATRMRYRFGVWNRPLEPLSDHPLKGGGLWVARKESDAWQRKKYLWKKHRVSARIFRCKIDRIIFENSYRVKTDGVFFTKKDEIRRR